MQSEPGYTISWSKVHKGFRAHLVLEKKRYMYMREMLAGVLTLTDGNDKSEVLRKDRTHIIASQQRSPREEIILKRLQFSHFH